MEHIDFFNPRARRPIQVYLAFGERRHDSNGNPTQLLKVLSEEYETGRLSNITYLVANAAGLRTYVKSDDLGLQGYEDERSHMARILSEISGIDAGRFLVCKI